MRKITMSYKINESVKHAYMAMTSIPTSSPMMKEHAQNVANMRNVSKKTPVLSNVMSASTKHAMNAQQSSMGLTKTTVLVNLMRAFTAEATAKIRV